MEIIGIIGLFILGVTISMHCVGMCGGFVLSASAGRKKEALFGYLGGKLAGYTLVGGVLGLIGSFFVITPEIRAALAIFAALFMIVYALSLLGVGFARAIYASLPRPGIERGSGPNPLVLGFLNAFIPCGPLQVAQLYALSTGSFIDGAAALFAFGLGTTPLLALFGGVASALTKNATATLMKVSGVVILLLSANLLWGGVVTFMPASSQTVSNSTGNVTDNGGIQVIRSELYGYGYEPDVLSVKEGISVRWIIDVKELTGCNNRILVPALGIDKQLSKGENVIEFTPNETGEIDYSCWMHMLTGKIIVGNESAKA